MKRINHGFVKSVNDLTLYQTCQQTIEQRQHSCLKINASCYCKINYAIHEPDNTKLWINSGVNQCVLVQHYTLLTISCFLTGFSGQNHQRNTSLCSEGSFIATTCFQYLTDVTDFYVQLEFNIYIYICFFSLNLQCVKAPNRMFHIRIIKYTRILKITRVRWPTQVQTSISNITSKS